MLLTLSSVAKRVREIGSLRAIGWSRGEVVRQIIAETIGIGILGGLIGIGIGAGVCAIIGAIGPGLSVTATGLAVGASSVGTLVNQSTTGTVTKNCRRRKGYCVSSCGSDRDSVLVRSAPILHSRQPRGYA